MRCSLTLACVVFSCFDNKVASQYVDVVTVTVTLDWTKQQYNGTSSGTWQHKELLSELKQSLEVVTSADTSAVASHQGWCSNRASFWNSNFEFWTSFSSTISSHQFYFVLFRFLFSLFLLFRISWWRLSSPWNKTVLVNSFFAFEKVYAKWLLCAMKWFS